VTESTKQRLWLLAYFLVLIAPFLLIMIGPRPEPREFWRELSVALGFGGLALMGVQFVPTARLRAFTNLFPLDVVYYFHPRASVLAFVLVLAHPLILFWYNPTAVQLLDPVSAPLRAFYGVISLVALIGLLITSVFRKELNINYETWRTVHAIFALIVVLTAMLHILGIDYYLAMPWQRWLWIVLTVVWVGLIINTRFVRPLQLLRRPYKIAAIRPEQGKVWTLALEPVDHEGMSFMPGQFAWLTIQRSPFAIRSHPFSIASSATTPRDLQFTIAELGDFTSQIHQIPVGERVYVDGPHGNFSIDRHHGPGYVFIAGGIGSPPMVSMLRTMAHRAQAGEAQAPAWFFYGNWRRETITFEQELVALQEALDLHVVHVLQEPPDDWTSETGFINADILDRHLPENRNDLVYFICGPVPMILAVEKALGEIGIPAQNVHAEQYDMV
jgi:predicted ferric reductase